MHIVGIDLSGPGNVKDTVLVSFFVKGHHLELAHTIDGASDSAIVEYIDSLEDVLAIGLDAPLSYNPGGGDRPGDRELRKAITAIGMKAGSIMVPTFTKMVYLTLRGIVLARMLGHSEKITEVHPGAVLGLSGAPLQDVLNFKAEPAARDRLIDWMRSTAQLHGIERTHATDHYVAACAAALGAWNWQKGEPNWLMPAALPHHPFDYTA
ncbi:MAG: DUF429 domain-containing protein [Verrucomicrobiota bacterium]